MSFLAKMNDLLWWTDVSSFLFFGILGSGLGSGTDDIGHCVSWKRVEDLQLECKSFFKIRR